MRLKVVIEPAEEGGFTVTVPALEGCCTQGETEEEALENAREAVLCYLEGRERACTDAARPGCAVREVEVER